MLTVVLFAATAANAQSFILDENQATVTGTWPNGSSQTSVAFGGDYIHDNLQQDGSYVEWSLTGQVDSDKCYEISAIWNANGAGTRATNVKYEIDHDGGTAESIQNQNINTNAFNVLSTSGGDSVFQNPTAVRVYTGDTPSSEKYIIADAIQVREEACEGGTTGPLPVSFGPANGSDMWTSLAAQKSLFVPHEDDCESSSEAFVEIASSGLGFCVEKSYRSAAAWEQARDICLQEDKRLPEIGEIKYICKLKASLGVTINTAYEWSSNYSLTIDTTNFGAGVAVPVFNAEKSCQSASYRLVAWNSTYPEDTASFRCIR